MQSKNPSKTSKYLLPESVYRLSSLRKGKGYSEAPALYEKNNQEKRIVLGAFERHVLGTKNTRCTYIWPVMLQNGAQKPFFNRRQTAHKCEKSEPTGLRSQSLP